MIRQVNIPIVVNLDENATDYADKLKAHQAAVEMAASVLDMMLLDGWREIASMPLVTPDAQSIQIILFKNQRAQMPRVNPLDIAGRMQLAPQQILQSPVVEAVGKPIKLNGE